MVFQQARARGACRAFSSLSPPTVSTSSTTNISTFDVQVAVIGAGVVGLAIARSLAKRGKEVVILERASAICSETSSRNSEVIHAGIYYPSTSYKSKFCVEGKQMLYRYCNENSIPYNNCGKLIVATNQSQVQTSLLHLQRQAVQNGVSDVGLLSKEDVRYLEPEIGSVVGALYSPSTGVIDSHSYYTTLLGEAEANGAALVLNTAVDDAQLLAFDGDNDGSGSQKVCIHADGTWLKCQTVINCAGLWASEVASVMHKNHGWDPPKQYFAKGTYFRLQGNIPPFRHLIYPVPEEGGLGIHATIGWDGCTTKFGPDVEWQGDDDDDGIVRPDDVGLNPDVNKEKLFLSEIQKYWPNVVNKRLVPDYVGIRPKLMHPNHFQRNRHGGTKTSLTSTATTFADFAIVGPKIHGIDGLIHLFGIESPGLTSSMSIAEYVSNLVD